MSNNTPVRWLAKHAAVGIKDLPRNVSWVLSKTLAEPAEQAANGTRDRARGASAAVRDALPIGSDSLETRLKRAREAAKQAESRSKRHLPRHDVPRSSAITPTRSPRRASADP